MEHVIAGTLSDCRTIGLNDRGFTIYPIHEGKKSVTHYNRRDYYKICLITGKNKITYGGQQFEFDDTILFFGNPLVPYSWEIISNEQQGYACLFKEEFFLNTDRSDPLQQSALFKIGAIPVHHLSNSEKTFIEIIFQKMLTEQLTDYIYQNDLIRNYIKLLIHEAQKIQPANNPLSPVTASARIATLFLEVLARQFPIEQREQRIQLRHPKDFANHLSIHVNHLNYTVREVTGKSTTQLISDRIASEAKSLLKNTDWSVADISYSLGFEYTTHFTNYFKRITGVTPRSVRDNN